VLRLSLPLWLANARPRLTHLSPLLTHPSFAAEEERLFRALGDGFDDLGGVAGGSGEGDDEDDGIDEKQVKRGAKCQFPTALGCPSLGVRAWTPSPLPSRPCRTHSRVAKSVLTRSYGENAGQPRPRLPHCPLPLAQKKKRRPARRTLNLFLSIIHQVVRAAAAAAGLSRGGIRRAAFSMGDLQALSAPAAAPAAAPVAFGARPAPYHALPEPSRLATVPEAPPFPPHPHPPPPPPPPPPLMGYVPVTASPPGIKGVPLAAPAVPPSTSGGAPHPPPGTTAPVVAAPVSAPGFYFLDPVTGAYVPAPAAAVAGHFGAAAANGGGGGGPHQHQPLLLAPLHPPGDFAAAAAAYHARATALAAATTAAGLGHASGGGSGRASGSGDGGGGASPSFSGGPHPPPGGAAHHKKPARRPPRRAGGGSEEGTATPAHAPPPPSRSGARPPGSRSGGGGGLAAMRRVQSAAELSRGRASSFGGRSVSAADLAAAAALPAPPVAPGATLFELVTPEGRVYTAGRLPVAERSAKILRYRQKRHERNFSKRIKYVCRKTLADARPRVRGRFARNDDSAAITPEETAAKKAAAAAGKEAAAVV